MLVMDYTRLLGRQSVPFMCDVTGGRLKDKAASLFNSREDRYSIAIVRTCQTPCHSSVRKTTDFSSLGILAAVKRLDTVPPGRVAWLRTLFSWQHWIILVAWAICDGNSETRFLKPQFKTRMFWKRIFYPARTNRQYKVSVYSSDSGLMKHQYHIFSHTSSANLLYTV